VLPLLVDVTAATELRLPNGEEAPMVRGHCVMLVVYVSPFQSISHLYTNKFTDYAKLTRKMGGKAMTSSNLRPKSLDHGSPTA
jgi:hypothetical protein